MCLLSPVDRIKDAQDRSDACSARDQADVRGAELCLILALKDTVAHIRASAHRSLTADAIADGQGADEVAHLATLWELLRPCVALDDKVSVTFGVNRRDR